MIEAYLNPFAWTPQTFSAIAAISSVITAVITAIFSYRLVRNNFLESIRPDLVLTGWTRQAENGNQSIKFSTVENFGKGAALHVSFGFAGLNESKTIEFGSNSASMPEERKLRWDISGFGPIAIKSGGNGQSSGTITLSNMEYHDHRTYGNLEISILRIEVYCFDTYGNRYLFPVEIYASVGTTEMKFTNTKGLLTGVDESCSGLKIFRGEVVRTTKEQVSKERRKQKHKDSKSNKKKAPEPLDGSKTYSYDDNLSHHIFGPPAG